MARSFGLTFDYLCPFARNAHEHVLAGLRGGADWDVHFTPYSLAQGHLEEGEPAVWDRPAPDQEAGVLALQVGLTVRDTYPERFSEVHGALFAARHDRGLDIKDPAVLRATLDDLDIASDDVFAAIEGGTALKVLREEHEAGVRDHSVWGVPTFLAGGRAVFVRLMDRPADDVGLARQRIDTVLDLVEGEPMIHEFKQTDLPR